VPATSDASHGKELFLDPKVQCASCHTLADAKSQGTIGPNLDDAFSTDKSAVGGSMDEQTIRDVIRGQIAYPEAPMPANLVRGKDADDVAAYIAKCAGNANCGVTATNTKRPPATTTTGGGGGGGGGTPEAQGKALFAKNCTSCHTLKDAGSTATVGPNLDQLKPDKARVARQVTNGGGVMPAFKGKLSPQEIQAVAAYVSRVAGK
jgi:mono/diheme cytochrome c family protein